MGETNWSLENLKDQWIAGRDEVENDKVIGGTAVVVGQYNYSYQHFVTDIVTYVYPEYRGGSAGIKLYKAVYQWAKEIKATEVHLDYQFSDDSEKIERFYKRLGYVPLGKRFKKEVIEEWEFITK